MFHIYPREVINIRDYDGSTLLIVAAKMGERTTMNVLLEREIDIDAQDVIYSLGNMKINNLNRLKEIQHYIMHFNIDMMRSEIY